MRILAYVSLTGFLLVSLACTPRASLEGCKAACDSLAALKNMENPVMTADDVKKKIKADMEPDYSKLQQELADGLKPINDECDRQLQALKGTDTPEMDVNRKCIESLDAVGKQFAPRFESLKIEEEKAVAKAVALLNEESEKALADLKSCTETCYANGTKITLVECQTKAKSVKEFIACE